jgi:hypothetical protein
MHSDWTGQLLAHSGCQRRGIALGQDALLRAYAEALGRPAQHELRTGLEGRAAEGAACDGAPGEQRIVGSVEVAAQLLPVFVPEQAIWGGQQIAARRTSQEAYGELGAGALAVQRQIDGSGREVDRDQCATQRFDFAGVLVGPERRGDQHQGTRFSAGAEPETARHEIAARDGLEADTGRGWKGVGLRHGRSLPCRSLRLARQARI